MKILGRILIILTAALLVAGVTWAFSQSNPTADLTITFVQQTAPPLETGDPSNSSLGLSFRRQRTWNLFILTELLRPLMIIAVIILVVAPLTISTRERR